LNIANLIFSSGSSFGQYRQISTGSNVGIATATPTERLTVFGNISSSGLLFPVSSSLVNYPELIKTGSSYVDVVNNMLYVFTGNGGVGGWRYTALS
jgi:hypothetical protein